MVGKKHGTPAVMLSSLSSRTGRLKKVLKFMKNTIKTNY